MACKHSVCIEQRHPAACERRVGGSYRCFHDWRVMGLRCKLYSKRWQEVWVMPSGGKKKVRHHTGERKICRKNHGAGCCLGKFSLLGTDTFQGYLTSGQTTISIECNTFLSHFIQRVCSSSKCLMFKCNKFFQFRWLLQLLELLLENPYLLGFTVV